VFLASLPLAIFGGATLSGFAWTMLFGIAIGTVSSIMIAAPILLLLGEHRLRRDVSTLPGKAPAPAAGRP
jgi:preprotein translocase subunit SecD/preprotein translocase subunit SecF